MGMRENLSIEFIHLVEVVHPYSIFMRDTIFFSFILGQGKRHLSQFCHRLDSLNAW